MKRLLIVCFLALLSITRVQAAVTAFGPGTVDVGIAVLYQSVIGCGWQYAINNDGAASTYGEFVRGGFDGGAELYAAFHQRCFFIRFSYYTWGSTNHGFVSRFPAATDPTDLTLIGLPNPPNNADPGWMEANARLRYTYSYLDLRLGQYIHKQELCSLGVYFNLRYLLRIEEKQRLAGRALLTTSPDLVQAAFEQNASFSGLGIGAGLNGEYCLWGNLSVGGHCNAVLMFGTQKLLHHRTEFDAAFTTDNTTENFRDHNTAIPLIDVNVKLLYNCCYGPFIYIAELGYGMNYFWKAISLSEAVNTSRECQNLGVGGPYARLSIRF